MSKMIWLTTLAVVLSASAAFAQQDLVQGNWEGKLSAKAWKDKPVAAKVVADRADKYTAFFLLTGPDGKEMRLRAKVTAANGKATIEGEDAGVGGKMWKIKATIAEGTMKGKMSGKGAPGAFTMARVEKKSPTLGAKPPAGAVVLLDGKNLDGWKNTDAAGEMWALVEGGAMEVRKGSLVTKQEFGDQKLHLEFRTPYMPSSKGQARGNSGVYLQGRYEVQVLDSFGLPLKDNECGGIYKKAVPKADACLPPTEWQTYDITFHAPQFDASGTKTKNARISVELNGIVIHDNVELDAACGGGTGGDEVKAGPLMLQDHHCKVQYRNIWVQAL